MSEPTSRELTSEPAPAQPLGPLAKDRILLAVVDPCWLHAYWELSPHSVRRAEAALKQDWHSAKPIIRLYDVTNQDTKSASETPVKDIVIQGVGNIQAGSSWYIDVPQQPRTYRADFGYLSNRGEFYVLARSNVVTPPKAGAGESTDSLEPGWADRGANARTEALKRMDANGARMTQGPEWVEQVHAAPVGFGSSGSDTLESATVGEAGPVLVDAKAIAITTARLAAVLHETMKDEAKLKRFLEMRRLKRRLHAGKVK